MINDSTAEVGGHTYRIGKLNARDQLHVYRRLAPLLAAAGGIGEISRMSTLAKSAADGGAPTIDQVSAYAAMLEPLLNTVAKLPDEDVDFIINTALRVVMRQMDGDSGWAPICPGGQMMYDDIGVLQMLDLTARVIIGAPGGGGIGDFFSAARPTLGAGAPLN